VLGEDEEANKTLAFVFELAPGAEPPADVRATGRASSIVWAR
jgi:hypothetical protein